MRFKTYIQESNKNSVKPISVQNYATSNKNNGYRIIAYNMGFNIEQQVEILLHIKPDILMLSEAPHNIADHLKQYVCIGPPDQNVMLFVLKCMNPEIILVKKWKGIIIANIRIADVHNIVLASIHFISPKMYEEQRKIQLQTIIT